MAHVSWKFIFVAAVFGVVSSLMMAEPATREAKELKNSVGMKFVRIAPGEFLMGSPADEKDRLANEVQHKVKITKPFYLAINDVTRGQFAAFVNDSGYKTDAEKEGWAYGLDDKGAFGKINGCSWRNPGFEQRDDHPVVEVSWNDAHAYCEWLSKKEGKHYQLPTEAQWEYACRAGAQTAYQWGNDPDSGKGWCNGADLTFKQKFPNATVFNFFDGFVYTSPVGSFKANAWGLYDMHGNVWQWCADWAADYNGDATDPTGPANGQARVLRGGSWSVGPRRCRCAGRYGFGPGARFGSIGFRVCLPLDSE